MQTKDLYQVLGQIIYSYSRIEFLISNIAYDIGLTETPYDFYGNAMFDKKLEALSNRIESITENPALMEEAMVWLKELREIKVKWNKLLQRIIFHGGNEKTFFEYRFKDKELINQISEYTADELRALNMDFIVALKKGAMLWETLKWVAS